MPTYAPKQYWERLLGDHYDERGVAYSELARSFNQAMYAALHDATARFVRGHGLVPAPGRVLDVGSGTGQWIGFWQRSGASEVVGLDLTDTAVASLRDRFPGTRFERADVGAEALPVDGPFDVVSAMSVLLHITDDERWRRAFANLAAVLRPGGHLVAIEPAMVHGWRGPPFGPESSSRARPVADYRAAAAAAGLELVDLRPATVLLANPGDARHRLTYALWERYWWAANTLVGQDERRGRIAGRVLLPLDALLRRALPAGPTAKLLLFRRTA